MDDGFPDGTTAHDLTFALADPGGRLASVRLAQEIGLPEPLAMTRTNGRWQIEVPRPDVDRMEYLFEIADHNGNRATILDPANPKRAPGAFGEKSVAEFAGYRAPGWLDVQPVAGTETAVAFPARDLGADLHALLWSPNALDDATPAPLLAVHDGPEFARLADFTHYLGASIAAGALPPVRAALLDPGDRNAWYSANPGYATALAGALDTVRATVPTSVTIGVGASLGALAMLHAHRTRDGLVDALLLQSGGFFTPRLDPQEAGFSGFAAVTGFVAGVLDARTDAHPVPTAVTCGTVEENLANNREMAAALQRLGYPATMTTVRDAHNFTAWRDAFDPHLTELITTVAATRAA